MIDRELNDLRRANPVSVSDVADIVAATRAVFIETIGAAEQPHVSLDATPSMPARSTRFGVLGSVAAALMLFAIPPLLLTRSPGDDDTEFPNLRTPPSLADVDSPEHSSAPERDDELLVSKPPPIEIVVTTIPTATHSTPSSSISPTSTTPPPTTSSTSAATSGEQPVEASPNPGASTAQPTSDDAAPSPSPTPAPTPTPSPTSVPATPAPSTTVSTTTTTNNVESRNPVPQGDAGQSFDPTVDLLVVTFDSADLDDSHAAAAARELATSERLDLLVVAGTAAPDAPGYVQPYPSIMNATWGSNWLDATANRARAVDTSADRWLATIDAGGVVRVAEGGVSDFTADVAREVLVRRPTLELASLVQLVHHNGRNEENTRVGDLDFLRANATYERIDDGNSANGTADLNARSTRFEQAALAGEHSGAWTAAFDYLPAESLDFSDTVTALHILGVGIDVVADPDDFATVFMT